MAKRKVKVDIKMDLLSQCKPAIVKRLLGPSFKLAPKDHLYVHKSTVEVIDPSWDAKAFSQAVHASQKRWMQILTSRVIDGLKKVDKDKKPPTEINNLKKVIGTTAKQIRDQADYFIKQTAEEASKDAPKWDKASDADDEMEDMEDTEKDLKDLVVKLDKSIVSAMKKFDKIDNKATAQKNKEIEYMRKKMAKTEKKQADGSTDDPDQIEYEHEKAMAKIKEDIKKEKKDFSKNAADAFGTYRSSRKSFHDMLKKAGKMTRKIGSKDEGDKAVKQLKGIFKKIEKEAKSYGDYLNSCDKDIINLVSRLKTTDVTRDDIIDVLPDLDKGRPFYAQVEAARRHMKNRKMTK